MNSRVLAHPHKGLIHLSDNDLLAMENLMFGFTKQKDAMRNRNADFLLLNLINYLPVLMC
jgi:hypothetical protein